MKTALQRWMDDRGFKDHQVSKLVGVSRTHISRIRRAKSGTNKALALRLQHLTKIDWKEFIEPAVRVPSALKRAANG